MAPNRNPEAAFQTKLEGSKILKQDLKSAILEKLKKLTEQKEKVKYMAYVERSLLSLKTNTEDLKLANELPDIEKNIKNFKIGGLEIPIEANFENRSAQNQKSAISLNIYGLKFAEIKLKNNNKIYFSGKNLANEKPLTNANKLQDLIFENSKADIIRVIFQQKLKDNFAEYTDTLNISKKTFQIAYSGDNLVISPFGVRGSTLKINLKSTDFLEKINKEGLTYLETLLKKEFASIFQVSNTPSYLNRGRYGRHYARRQVVHYQQNVQQNRAPNAPVQTRTVNSSPQTPDILENQRDILQNNSNERSRVPVGPRIPLGSPQNIRIELKNPLVEKKEEIVVPPPLPPLKKPEEDNEALNNKRLKAFETELLKDKSIQIKQVIDFSKKNSDFASYYAKQEMIKYLIDFGAGSDAESVIKDVNKYRCVITKNNDILFYRLLDGEKVITHLFRDSEERKNKNDLPTAITFSDTPKEFVKNFKAAIKSDSAKKMRTKNLKMITEDWLFEKKK